MTHPATAADITGDQSTGQRIAEETRPQPCDATLPARERDMLVNLGNVSLRYVQPREVPEMPHKGASFDLKLELKGPDAECIGSITIGHLTEELSGSLVAGLFDFEQHARASDNQVTPPILSPSALRLLLQAAHVGGAQISTALGQSPLTIAERYRDILSGDTPAPETCPIGIQSVQVMEYVKGNGDKFETREQMDLTAELSSPATKGAIRWIDIKNPTAETLLELKANFGFEQCDLEDCATSDKRTVLREYSGHSFVVINQFSEAPDNMRLIESRELHCFVGPDFVITLHHGEIPALEAAATSLSNRGRVSRLRGGGDFFVAISASLMEGNHEVIKDLEGQLPAMDSELNRGGLRRSTLRAVLPELDDGIHTIDGLLSWEKRVITSLSERPEFFGGENPRAAMRSLSSRMDFGLERLHALERRVDKIRENNRGITAERANDITKRIAILEAIALPTIAVAGIFGMNFTSMPFNSDMWMWGAFLGIAAITSGFIVRARLDRWWR